MPPTVLGPEQAAIKVSNHHNTVGKGASLCRPVGTSAVLLKAASGEALAVFEAGAIDQVCATLGSTKDWILRQI
jgi:hypothetical protein